MFNTHANIEYDCPHDWAVWFQRKAFCFGNIRLELQPNNTVNLIPVLAGSSIGLYSFDAALDYTALPFNINECHGSFCCDGLLLKTLAQTPRQVFGNFQAKRMPNIKTLKDGPLHVTGDYYTDITRDLRTRIDGTLHCRSTHDISPETLTVLIANKTKVKPYKRSRLSEALNAYAKTHDYLALLVALHNLPQFRNFSMVHTTPEPTALSAGL